MTSGPIDLIDFAELALEARGCSLAILAQDFDEARFRASVVVVKARKFNQPDVAVAAAAAVRALGPAGHPPGIGYGAHVLEMAMALDAIQPEGIEKDGLAHPSMDDPDVRQD